MQIHSRQKYKYTFCHVNCALKCLCIKYEYCKSGRITLKGLKHTGVLGIGKDLVCL